MVQVSTILRVVEVYSQITTVISFFLSLGLEVYTILLFRLVYSVKHVVRSVAVASLISWHGVWYVVHLGPNPRPLNIGTVDAPSVGRGVAGPAGGC